MLTKLFAIGCRTGMAVSVTLGLGSVPASAAPLGARAAVPAKAKAGAKATTAATAKARAKPKPKAKPVAPVDLLPLPDPVRSDYANRMIAWVETSRDNGKLPYIVIDKPAAMLSLFAANGDFLGETPVLLGIGIGDDSSPGVGAKKLEDIGPAERTTPAGRFVAKFGKAFGRERVLWVDYANSVALHAVITTHKSEQRVARLLSPSPDDNRISFGCINVGTSFYTKHLRPLFLKRGGVVYILPDTKPLDAVFPRVRLLPYLNAPGASPATAATATE
ncbi:hypothetical protein [Sphingomonas sp. PAMC 26621]|uniref:hypothetical protein n=1 Tax=Sphingomonas sp. PAMC 26621 TaxID=1112213 RepID=UPI000289CE18